LSLLQSGFIKRLTVLAVFGSLLFSAPAIAQNFGLGFGLLVSPGDLAQAHHEFDSITKCIECHDLTGGVSEDKCLDCH
jgi:hypothetical protein